jgi:hypothetical protein
MKYYLTILIFCIAFISLIESKPDSKQPSDCLIKNIKFQGEYLYTCYEFEGNNKRKVYSNPASLNYMNSFDQIRWLIMPVENMNNTFHIINARYGEHLCSSTGHLEIFNQRRKVNTVRFTKDVNLLDKKCMWRLDEVDQKMDGGGSDRYLIWNVQYKEALYAASSLLKTVKARRNVFTWYKPPDSKQFIWHIFCFNDDMLA